MKTKLTTDFSPPPKMKKKRKFTKKELLQLEKNKKGKKKILPLQNIEKKRGFTMAELSPQPIMRKKIKRTSPPKQPSNSLPKHIKLTNIKFLIEDVPSPPKYIKLTKTNFLIEDIRSPPKQPSNSPPKQPSNSPPKQPSNSPPKRISGSPPLPIVPNPYCSCSGNCDWCQLHRLLEKSAHQNGNGKSIIAHKIRKRK